jgi:hypothetical protein
MLLMYVDTVGEREAMEIHPYVFYYWLPQRPVLCKFIMNAASFI